jgi:hypothetical protein
VNNNTELNQNTTWALYEGVIGNTPNQVSTTGTFNVVVDSTTNFYICGYGGVNLNGPTAVATISVYPSIWATSISACGSYTWGANGTTYTTSGIYSESFTSVHGCDSTLTLNLTIHSQSTLVDSVTACAQFYWPASGITYYSSGNYNATFTGINGCDSLLILNLTIDLPSSSVAVETACDSFTWIDGNSYSASTSTPTWILTNAAGCDSIVSLDLTIYPSTTSTIVDSAMDSYSLNGIDYTTSGSYVQIIPNSNGCDSLINLNLTISYTGIDELALAELSLFPNPSNGHLQIDWDETIITILELELLDNSGRIIQDLVIDSHQHDLSNLVCGVYYVKVVSNQGISYMKWVRH